MDAGAIVITFWKGLSPGPKGLVSNTLGKWQIYVIWPFQSEKSC